ncbi:hypothetical protein [Romboutsia lituseburensis]|uniref:hypothetical protein n=1 Tax=Romboutsia lituseburensis TaxID=1537 RepID=UPI0022EB0948|nr:hypothetical protein [Romboutsia lituseburensis]
MKQIKSKLILNTFDGTMKKLSINPKCTDSKVEFNIKYYNEEDILTKASIIFKGVIAIDFEINYFDNFIGSELFGFYEIFETAAKINMLEKIFNNRLEGYLYHGNYNYDPNEEHDMLNYREPLNEIIKKIDNYRLYQQETGGGIFYILALDYEVAYR